MPINEIFAKVRVLDVARSRTQILDDVHIFQALFLRHASLIVDELFPLLQDSLNDPAFEEKFLMQYKNEAKDKLAELNADIQKCLARGVDAGFYMNQMPYYERITAIESLDHYLKALHDPAEGYKSNIDMMSRAYIFQNDGREGGEYVKEYYPLYRMGLFLYDSYVKKSIQCQDFEDKGKEELVSLYKEKLGIDLTSTDPQFLKYGLLSLGNDMTIHNNKESQALLDSRVGLYFSIRVPFELLKAIEHAIGQNWIPNIAFSIGTITETLLALEAKEYGEVFSFQALLLPSLSKLYADESYNDSLWIKVENDPSSMTFEELCADFTTLDGNVITQVVHLEFFVENDKYFICHLDHEYILYTEDAYHRRRFDSGVKGHKKCKTFKIDNARIPFDFAFENRYFLLIILNGYFKNKGLIREYFERVS